MSEQSTSEDPVVETLEGCVKGRRLDGVDAFLGLHYGESTAGARRFAAPVPVAGWSGTRDATQRGEPCYQGFGGEDCLVLNVWAPREVADAPVMVFLHGGGYRGGSGGEPMYDGASLAERSRCVVITVNHRLHVLGFALFAPKSRANGASTANAGLLDLVEALRWTQRNVAAFGGDPDNVTVIGESGGGGKVCCLMAMPSARGLFHQAVVQSGSQRKVATPEAVAEDMEAALVQLDRAGAGPADLADLPVERVYESYLHVEATRPRSFATLSRMPFVPVLDEETLPWHPDDPRALALSADVSLLVGTNDDETAVYRGLDPGLMASPTDDADLARRLTETFELLDDSRGEVTALVAAYRKESPHADAGHLFGRATSDLWMTRDLQAHVEERLRHSKASTYVYRFGWPEPCFGGRYATHAAELLFLFDKLDGLAVWGTPPQSSAADYRGLEHDRVAVRDTVIEAWTAFARTGVPASAHVGTWPAHERDQRSEVRIDVTTAVNANPPGPEIRNLLKAFDVGAGA